MKVRKLITNDYNYHSIKKHKLTCLINNVAKYYIEFNKKSSSCVNNLKITIKKRKQI